LEKAKTGVRETGNNYMTDRSWREKVCVWWWHWTIRSL